VAWFSHLLDAYDPGRLGRAVDVRTTALDHASRKAVPNMIRTIRRVALTGLATAALAAVAFAGPASAAPNNSQSRVSTVNLVDRPDSGEDGNFWATDRFLRKTTITQVAPGQYVAVIEDTGQVDPTSGELTPGSGDGSAVIADNAPNGTVRGGFTTVQFTAAPNFATYTEAGMRGTFSGVNPSTSGTWVSRFFDDIVDGTPTSFASWSWVYETPTEYWVNDTSGNSGNITGLLPQHAQGNLNAS
jgi:hypothetical protein